MHRLPPLIATEAHTPGTWRALAPRSTATAPCQPGTWAVRVVSATLAALGLTGCVSTVPTTPGATPSPSLAPDVPVALSRLPALAAPAPGAPGAKFTVRAALISNQQRAGLVRLLDNAQCRQPHLVGVAPRSSSNSPSGNAPGTGAPAAPATNESVSMTAGEPVTLDWLVVDGARMVCAVRWSFTPQANRHYLVQGVSLGTVCSATLTDVTQPDRPRTPEDLRYRTDAGKTCVPIEQARRVPPGMLEGGQVNGEAVLRPLATEEDLKGLIKP